MILIMMLRIKDDFSIREQFSTLKTIDGKRIGSVNFFQLLNEQNWSILRS